MKTACYGSMLLLVVVGVACDSPVEPERGRLAPDAVSAARAAQHTMATGTFTQTGITHLELRQAGPNTLLEQTSTGVVAGTLTGTYTDDLRVVIHPDGHFNAQFTIRCDCTFAGGQGIVEFTASDSGELVSPTLATFAGRAVIRGGSASLSHLRGVLEIEGSIDLVTGLSHYDYAGWIH